jgi:hypothetical protein
MGYGAFMNIQNNRSEPIQTFLTNVSCMFDGGTQGSNLSLFNNATIPPHSSLPQGWNQYIEVDATGGCFFASQSTFNIKIEDATNHAIIGEVDFIEYDNTYEAHTNTNPDVIDALVENNKPQARIEITVEATDYRASRASAPDTA